MGQHVVAFFTFTVPGRVRRGDRVLSAAITLACPLGNKILFRRQSIASCNRPQWSSQIANL